MSFATTMTALKGKVDGLIANRVAKFAYTQQAYNSDTVNGVENYDFTEEQNIPLGTTSVLKVNETVLTKGWRTQASAITRMLMNHFLGRTSYNLNKTVDFLKAFMVAVEDNMGVADGFASLDSTAKLPLTQLTPDVVQLKGDWDADTNTPELEAGEGRAGDMYRVSVTGTQNLGEGSMTYRAGDTIIYNGTIWKKTSSGTVSSVNTVTPDENGNVTITGEDIDTSLEDNTKISDKFRQTLKLSYAWMLGTLYSWKPSNITTGNFYVPIKAKGIWVVGSNLARGNTTYGIKYSVDGKTWNDTNITTGNCEIVYDNGIFIATGLGTYGVTGIKYSEDGITWLDTNITTLHYKRAKYLNGKWFAVQASRNIVVTSEDGVTWTEVTVGSSSSAVLRDVYFENSIYFISTTTTTGGLFYSINGVSWSKVTLDTTVTSTVFYSPVFGNGIFVCGGNNSVIYSTDGINWSEGVNSSTTAFADLNNILYVPAMNQWIATSNIGRSSSSNTGKGIFKSNDGINWFNNGTTGFYNMPVLAKGRIYLCPSQRGTVFKRSFKNGDSDLASAYGNFESTNKFDYYTVTSVKYINGVFLAGSEAGVMTSFDGWRWYTQEATIYQEEGIAWSTPVYSEGVLVSSSSFSSTYDGAGIQYSSIDSLIEDGDIILD